MRPRRATSVTEPATWPFSTYASSASLEPLEALGRKADAVGRARPQRLRGRRRGSAEQDETESGARRLGAAWIVIPRSNESERQHTGGRRPQCYSCGTAPFGVSAVDVERQLGHLSRRAARARSTRRAPTTRRIGISSRALTASSWYLPHNQTYRGHGVLVFDPHHATRLDQLTSNEWQAYAADLHRVVARDRQPSASPIT